MAYYEIVRVKDDALGLSLDSVSRVANIRLEQDFKKKLATSVDFKQIIKERLRFGAKQERL